MSEQSFFAFENLPETVRVLKDLRLFAHRFIGSFYENRRSEDASTISSLSISQLLISSSFRL